MQKGPGAIAGAFRLAAVVTMVSVKYLDGSRKRTCLAAGKYLL